MELWSAIPGHDGYFVSNLGRVRSPRKVLKPFVVKSTGYMQVNLSGRTRHFVHRLVASAFCPKGGGPVVNHLNGDKSDNRACNLEWTTIARNNRHKFSVLGLPGSCKGRYGIRHPKSIPIVATCLKTGHETFYWSGSDATRDKGFTSTGMSASCRGKISHHAGYKFRFATDDDLAQYAERRGEA